MSKKRPYLRLGALALSLSTAVTPAVAQSARVDNTASLDFDGSAGRQTILSNMVALDVDLAKRPTSISFRLLPVGYELGGLKCETSPNIVFTPAQIDRDTLARSPRLEALDAGVPLIIVLDNQAGNHDSTVRESSRLDVQVGTRTNFIELWETGTDTGVFAGGVPAANPPEGSTLPENAEELAACDPGLGRNGSLDLTFTEDAYSLSSSASLLLDPAGYVFDSSTGALVDGATVSLLDGNGRPATVFGDDGISRYPSTVVSGASTSDASGRFYDFSQGNYRFPLVAPGAYHLQITPPARYTAPSTKSSAELAKLRDPKGKPFLLNEASFGGQFVLTTPDPFFSDIPLDRQGESTLLLTKTASVREATPGDFIQYRISVTNRDTIAVGGTHLTDILPVGLRYQTGSTRGGTEPAVSTDSRNLDFTIPTIGAGQSLEITYVVSVSPNAPTGEALNRVLASGGNGATSNEAAASVRLKRLLFTSAFTMIGRVTEGDCGDPMRGRKGVAGIRLLLEDGTFVTTDKDGLYHFEGVRPGSHVVQIDTASIPGRLEAVACDADTRQAGSAISRFVEGQGGVLKRVDFQLRPSGRADVAAQTLPIAVATDAEAAGSRDYAGQQPGIAFLFPEIGHNPRAPVLRVVIKHYPGQRVALTLNGDPVDPLAFDATDTDAPANIAISRWTGLPLRDGDNALVARILGENGQLVETLTRTVHASGGPVRAALVEDKSRLIADGLTRPLIAVRVTDRDGKPVRAGTLVPFRVDQPFAAAADAALDSARSMNGNRGDPVARVVGDEGIAFLTLEPTNQAGGVHAVIRLTGEHDVRSSDIRTWLSASAKDWTVVGFGAGTLGYDTLRSRSSALPRSQRNSVVTDGQIAFYAKGRIKGSWLLTLAYDSDRSRDRDRGLLGTIDPDRYYTVYGDGSRQGYDAATERKLYIRLERREFYALFGDFETGMTASQLGRYSRTLNGVKAEYRGKVVTFTAFASHTDELYGRDEIQGNGLTGPYRLAGRDIVPNSDKLRIEIRDRFRPELILSSTQMTRHVDYDIDTSFGTIRFREPVLSRDANLNPVFIVVDYESYGRGRNLVAGGRVAAKLADGKVDVGASVIRDETVSNATVAAVDFKARPAKDTEIRAEAATGGRGGINAGRAYLVEAEHHGAAIDALAYVRQQDSGFGVGQQNISEAGTRKIGVDGRIALNERLSVATTAWYQEQLNGPATRTAVDAKLEYRRANGTLFVGGQFADDRGIDGGDRQSRLITVGGTQSLLGGKLTLGGQTQFAPGGKKDSVDFPIRHQITAAYRISTAVRLLGGYEIAKGSDFTAHTAQIGFDVAPWAGAKFTSTINQQVTGQSAGQPIAQAAAQSAISGENGQRVFANYGASQSLPIGSHWTIDATLDASSTVSGAIPTGGVVNAFQPVASGGFIGQSQSLNGQANGDFTAVTLGAGYRGGSWSWNGRIEYRHASDNDRWGVTSNLLRSLGEGKTLASSVKYYKVKQASGDVASYATADLSLAWRPLDSRWSVLNRFEFRNERADKGFNDSNVLGVPAYGGGQTTLRLINNLAVNYRTGAEGAGHGLEATVYYGSKWVRGSFGPDDYEGYIDVTGFDLRHDLGRHFDIGVQGSMQHAWSQGTKAFSFGPSVGVSPAPNVWISAGYNVSGYRDRDFEDDRYTRSGAYVTMRLKFDQLSLGGLGRTVRGNR